MHTKSDAELLLDYRTTGCEEAFGEMVSRYADFVYSAALRQVGSPENARDVAQVVFTDLVRKAGSLGARTLLAGWLYRATRFAAMEQLRRDRRRLQRERQAMELPELSSEPGTDWTEIRRLLDEGIANLAEEDRNALLLRFFRNESLTKVGAMLGVSEDAAQKRVSRALVRLKEFLGTRGINTTAQALSAAITTNAVQAAPAGLSASLTSSALAASTQGQFVSALAKVLSLTNMKTTIVILVSTGALLALAFQYLDKDRLLREARVRTDAQSREIMALRAANDELSRQTNELQALAEQQSDLLRLRAEVTRLRREQATLKKTAAAAGTADANLPPQATERQILVVSKLLSLPTGDLSKAISPQVPGGGFRLVGDDEANVVLGALKGIEGIEMIAEPRIQTANGVEASLSSTRTVPLDGTKAEVGAILNVNPHYSTNSPYITLDIRAQLSEIAQDASQKEQPPSALRLTEITNSVTVIDGQSIILRQDFAQTGRPLAAAGTATGPRSLLVFLTPHLLDADGTYQRLKAIVKSNDR